MSGQGPLERGRMKKIPQIEAIRVLAMAGIFLYHVWSVVPSAGTENPAGPLFGLILSQGYLGVVVFNIISGFVLALPHLPPQARPPMPYADFFRRRFTRICPQYYISLTLWSAVALAAGAMPAAALFASFAEHVFFVHTLDPARFFSIAPAFWWMGLLAQFYLFFPLALRAMLRFGPGKTLGAACLLCWGGWRILALLAGDMPHSHFPLIEYMMTFNLPGRLPEFVLGMSLASWWKAAAFEPGASAHKHPDTGVPRYFAWLMPLLAALFIAAAALFKDGLPKPYGQILLVGACLFTSLALFSQPMIARLGRTRRVAAWAAASYSFYLLHQPLLGYGKDILGDRLSPFAAFCLLCLVCAPAALALSKAQDKLAAKFF